MREMTMTGSVVSSMYSFVPKIPKNKILLTISTILLTSMSATQAEPVAGARVGDGKGPLDPLLIPKYVTPLVIPPAMPKKKCRRSDGVDRTAELTASFGPDYCNEQYEIAVRQFKQQILPARDINGKKLNKTTVWSYGSVAHKDDARPASKGGTFNYPAFTIEATTNTPTRVRWKNQLVDKNGDFLPHLLNGRKNGGRNGVIGGAVDQTLHWANPERGCLDTNNGTDCAGTTREPYVGPVPIVTHVHGAHVGPESDGYPEAWWLPTANNIPDGTATEGALYPRKPYLVGPTGNGEAIFTYPNTQRSSILWYHDHTLGMTRLNVYAGPAGFYILRNKKGGDDGIEDEHVLPGPAPQLGDAVGTKYYDIPLAIQDRSFYADGQLFYPKDRAFFEELEVDDLDISFAPDVTSDIAPIWNPEAFFNTMVVNGKTWPYLDVDRTRYRFRLLNGSNSRFLNLAMFVVNEDGSYGKELPFWVIGAEQGLLPRVVRVKTGKTKVFWDSGKQSENGPPVSSEQALLMAPAERLDVIVNFRSLKPGQTVRMINTAPDSPFGGFVGDPGADPDTSGQIMEFKIGESKGPNFSNPKKFNLKPESPLKTAKTTRYLSLIEEESGQVCVITDDVDGSVHQMFVDEKKTINVLPGDGCIIKLEDETEIVGEPFGPKAAVLGTAEKGGGKPKPQLWSDPITTNPGTGDTEIWELWNYTADSHPIHLHLVSFEVLERRTFKADGFRRSEVEPWETGRKDTVISYPGEVTIVKAKFDKSGLYVWHCHIVEHEDNEMMLPFYVGDPENSPLPMAW